MGRANPANEGWRQIDAALAHGRILLILPRCIQPIPCVQKRPGIHTGHWPGIKKRRDEVVLATKVTGEGHRFVREGAPISAATIRTAVDNSLKSMNTDYIDIYQLHWPNRGSYMFRKNWHYDPSPQDSTAFLEHVEEVLDEMDRLVKAGKIRYGLSNESARGTSVWLNAANAQNSSFAK